MRYVTWRFLFLLRENARLSRSEETQAEELRASVVGENTYLQH